MQTAPKQELIIVDASVMIKWCVREEEEQEQILRMQEDFMNKKIRLAFPALLEWELNNYLSRKFTSHEATQKYSYFKLLQCPWMPLNLELSHLAFKITHEHPGLSFYDASYHAMALQLKATFFTADAKYYKRAKALGSIKLLKDY